MRVFSNTAMSADGKIGTFRQDHVAIGSPEDLRTMSVLRAQADGVLVGGQTFRNWPLPLVERPEALREPASGRRPILNAVLTRRGVVTAENAEELARRWPDPRVRMLILGAPGLDVAAHQAALDAEVLLRDTPDVGWAIEEMRARGCEDILVEAGGDILFQLVEQGVLTELYITVCPLLIGGRTAPTPLDGQGFDATQLRRLRLLEVRQLGEELFLRYAIRS